MDQWKTSSEFEAVVESMMGKRVGSPGPMSIVGDTLHGGFTIQASGMVEENIVYHVPNSNTFYAHPSTASKITDIVSARTGKQEPMSRNTKTYEVVLSSGAVHHVNANSVTQDEGRISFTGYVEGVSPEHSPTVEVVQSFRSELVDTYRTLPAVEQDGRTVGVHTYRVHFKDGATKDVVSDIVAHQNGTEHSPGRFTLATKLAPNREHRVEFSVPETEVHSIARVVPEETSKAVAAPRDSVEDKAPKKG